MQLRVPHPSHATVVAYLALFLALGGTSYAAVAVTGKDVTNKSLHGRDLANGTVTGRQVHNGSLTGKDVKKASVPLDRLAGKLPAGPAGPPGAPDYSRVYDKAAADARFAKGAVQTRSTSVDVPASSGATLLNAPDWGNVSVLNCTASFANVGLLRDGTSPSSLWYSTSTSPAGGSAGTAWASVGSYSAPSGWVHYVMGKQGASMVIDAYGRWNGAGCSFTVTLAEYSG